MKGPILVGKFAVYEQEYRPGCVEIAWGLEPSKRVFVSRADRMSLAQAIAGDAYLIVPRAEHEAATAQPQRPKEPWEVRAEEWQTRINGLQRRAVALLSMLAEDDRFAEALPNLHKRAVLICNDLTEAATAIDAPQAELATRAGTGEGEGQ